MGPQLQPAGGTDADEGCGGGADCPPQHSATRADLPSVSLRLRGRAGAFFENGGGAFPPQREPGEENGTAWAGDGAGGIAVVKGPFCISLLRPRRCRSVAGESPPLHVIAYTRTGENLSNVAQISPVLPVPEMVCPVRRQPLSAVGGRKRYNTLDFASQSRVPGGRRPLWIPLQKGVPYPF